MLPEAVIVWTVNPLLIVTLPITAPVDITLEIDGLAGLSCGEYFNIDGVPEIYNQTGVFQITNTKHQIDTEGWKTTIEAGYRIVNKA